MSESIHDLLGDRRKELALKLRLPETATWDDIGIFVRSQQATRKEHIDNIED